MAYRPRGRRIVGGRTPVAVVCAVVLSISVVATALVAASVGAAGIPLRELVAAASDPSHPSHHVLWRIRVPRIVTAALVGASLAIAGTLMQTVVRNPLADPGIMGITAGAGLGGLLAIVLAPAYPALIPIAAFAGAMLAATVLVSVAWTGVAVAGPLRIILSGVAVQAILFSLIALVTFFFAERAPAFAAFTIGSLNGVGWSEVRAVGATAVIGIVLALLFARPLNVLLLDDDSALGVGLSVWLARLGALGVAALLTGGATAVAGLVGFVGLVVPNWLRALVGPEHTILLPLCILGGATLVIVADTTARTAVAPLELPVGALLALVGGPYFLVMLWRRVA